MPKIITGQVNKQFDLLERSKELCEFLLKYSEEIEIELDNISVKRMSFYDDMMNKEQILSEINRANKNNINLFSPVYSKDSDTTVLNKEINDIMKEISKLNEDEQQLLDKKNVFIQSYQCIEKLSENSLKTDKEKDDILDINKIDMGINLLQAQESERQRIARELHDSTVQNLTGLVHKTELCGKLIDMDIIRAKLELNTMSITIRAVINDMRDIIYNLKPMSLEDLGFVVTLERYANQLNTMHGLRVAINSNTEVRGVLPVINLTLFRVIQEACQNVIKHAKASTIEISINYKENEIIVIVKDDGIGFDLGNNQTKIREGSRFGLSIMRERVNLLSGKFKIQSEKEKGTEVIVTVPITKCEGV